ncbi:MAG: hypothetical protein NZL87_07915, partial [Thermomicrobium sp.]|nr:hypothetical protein [Thermomicrobium sp.]
MAADRLPEELLRRIRDDEAFRRALLDVLLGEEFLRLPTEVRRLEEAIERLTAAVDRGYREMEQRAEALTARMERVEAQIEALTAAQRETTEQIRALAERMERVETQIEALTARMERAEAQIEALARGMDQMTEEMRLVRQRVDHSVGLTLELRYQMRARAILGRFLRQIRAGTVGDVGDLVVARLSESDAEEVFATDLLIRGVSRTKPEVGEIWIAVE